MDRYFSADHFDSLIGALRNPHGIESTTLEDGTSLVGKLAPRSDELFQDGYLHEVYAPLSNVEIDSLERLIGKELPQALRNFYGCANGLALFCGSFTIRGLRPNANRRDAELAPLV